MSPQSKPARGKGRSAPGLGRMFALEVARVTERAALAAFPLIGRGDEKSADQAAVDAMRRALNELAIDGEVVIGEGERDAAPMLFIGEKVGRGEGPKLDIALDPLEGTTLTAKGMNNALAVVAIAERGSLLNAPDVYMEKIALGGGFAKRLVSLQATPAENVRALARAKKCPASEITVCVLDRPRHERLIADVRKAGARVHLISDGDVAGVMHTADAASEIDLYMGIGGAPEGVLAAAALRCTGGQMEGRLLFADAEQEARARRMGIAQLDKVYTEKDMAGGDVMFAATGVTDGSLLSGVRRRGEEFWTETLLMRAASGTRRWIRTAHRAQKVNADGTRRA